MKKKANANIWWFVASLCFYISAIIGFFTDGGIDVMSLCIGCSFQLIGCSYLIREKKNEEKTISDNEDND